jgi:hypothetical protein
VVCQRCQIVWRDLAYENEGAQDSPGPDEYNVYPLGKLTLLLISKREFQLLLLAQFLLTLDIEDDKG